MEKIVFADTFTKTFKKVIKVPSVVIDDPIFRLHYKFTGLALLFASILVSGYQFFGNPIMCIQRDDVPEQLLNTYCWIEGTFTLPKALTKKVGTEVVHPGVDKYEAGDEVVEHSYYQWVCFVLFLQATIFCFPHFLWRNLESGRMKNLVQKLRNPVLTSKESEECFNGLACYFRGRRFEHQYYAIKFLFCEILNLVIVIAQIYFIDVFLGGQFRKYGIEVIKYANEEQENRLDPMIKVFPRITKCTFHKYGSSGDVQKHDALCLLPLNIINEKIFIVMWFWFVILAVLDGALLLYRLIVIISGQARYLLLSCVASLTSRNEIKSLIPTVTYGDWFLLYLLADNIDNVHFRKFILELKHGKCPPTFEPGVVKLDDVDKGLTKEDIPSNNKDESVV
ncbi:innexin inx2-like [Argiope bruennichi]|uniref:Innexin n=1 Tax=Argiope bruennichi TaxID=94029 RepID=A0A8T0EM51_ARGBR|nr:innexin inx2-like [Argiope bruennichi]KAF8773766.1 Innexin inx2 like protein [Argiope bruennichi]